MSPSCIKLDRPGDETQYVSVDGYIVAYHCTDITHDSEIGAKSTIIHWGDDVDY